jgi:hypothetical protein
MRAPHFADAIKLRRLGGAKPNKGEAHFQTKISRTKQWGSPFHSCVPNCKNQGAD